MFRRRGARDAGNSRPEGPSQSSGADVYGRPVERGRAAPDAAGHDAKPPEPFTYIQRGTQMVGRLEAVGRVRVHGVVKGDVTVDGALEVAEHGLVEGASVEADEVKIIGRVVVQRLVARGKVEIWDGGELIGDVQAASLDIEEGARFTGRSEMAGGESPATDADAADTLLEPAKVGRTAGVSVEKAAEPL